MASTASERQPPVILSRPSLTHYFQKSSVLSEGPHAPEEGQREDEGSRQAHVTSRVQEKVDGVVDSLLFKNEDVRPHGHEG